MELENNDNNLIIKSGQNTQGENQCRVKVAVRVRPLIPKEQINNESIIVTCNQQKNEIIMGKDKIFTYDQVFDIKSTQNDIYNSIIQDLVLKSFEGYNATVLAYGQTGSGKTYTMGTCSLNQIDEEQGIVNRVIFQLFDEIKNRSHKADYVVKVSYFEIYNDSIIDLLSDQVQNNKREKNQSDIVIREENEQICVYGLHEETVQQLKIIYSFIKVKSPEEMKFCLDKGGFSRTTATTLMNQSSSRSHAIFTIYIEQSLIEDLYKPENNKLSEFDQEEKSGYTKSKFHFVDLAGSERQKKTGALGSTLREGININMGLSALGNVISALTDKKIKHIPYRDSKLTRILQDSLGGNSNTVMIACVSPAQSNLEESISTLRYAQRARMIKNKPVVNRDPNSAMISQLKQQIFELKQDIFKFKAILKENNIDLKQYQNINILNAKENNNNQLENGLFSSPIKKFNNNNSLNLINYNSNQQIGQDFIDLEQDLIRTYKIKCLQQEKDKLKLQAELQTLKKAQNESEIENLQIIKERDQFRLMAEKAKELLDNHGISYNFINIEHNLVNEYQQLIEKLRNEVQDKEKQIKEISIQLEDSLSLGLKDHQILVQTKNKYNVLKKKYQQLEETNNVQKINKNEIEINNQVQNSIENFNSNINISTIQTIQHNGQDIFNEENFDKINSTTPNKKIIFGNNAQDEDENDEEEENDILVEEIIKDDKAYQEYQQTFESQSNNLDQQLNQLEKEIKRNEKQKKKMTDDQIFIQQNLLDQMKEQHYQKINQIEKDKKLIEQQRDQAMMQLNSSNATQEQKNNMNNLKHKVQELEDKIRDLKNQEKLQQTLKQKLEQQNKLILNLDKDIKSFKQQKIDLNKLMKEKADSFEHFKITKYKEIMKEKKKNQQKDNQIFQLKQDNRKKQLQLNRKNQENQRLKKQKELIAKIIKPNQKNKKKPNLKQQQQQQLQQSISLNASIELQQNQEMNEETMENYLDGHLLELMKNVENQIKQLKLEEKISQIENELSMESDKHSEFQIQIEQIEITLQQYQEQDQEFNEQEEIVEKKKDLKNEEEICKYNIDNLEMKLEILQNQIKEIQNECMKKPFEQIEQDILLNEKLNNDLKNYKLMIKVMIEKFLGNAQELVRKEEEVMNKQVDNEQLQQIIDNFPKQLKIIELDYEKKLNNLEEQYKSQINNTLNDSQDLIENEDNSTVNRKSKGKNGSVELQEINQTTKEQKFNYMQNTSTFINKQNNLDSYQLKDKEKQITDLHKKLKSLQQQYDQVNKSNHFLQQKINEIKTSMPKDKFIGIQQLNLENQQKNLVLQSINYDENMNNVNNNNQSSNMPQLKQNQQLSKQITNIITKNQQYQQQKQLNNNNIQQNISSLQQQRNVQKANKKQENTSSNSIDQQLQQQNMVLEDLLNNNVAKEKTKKQKAQISPHKRSHTISLDNFSSLQSDQIDLFVSGYDPDSIQQVYKWESIHTFNNGQDGQVFCLQNFNNFLYSSSQKAVKIWDLESQKKKLELQKEMIKGMAVLTDHNAIATAGIDKQIPQINIWDANSMQKSQVKLNGHKDQINCLYYSGDLLYSGGKGTNSYSFYAWDLRQPENPLFEEKEKNYEIFSIIQHEKIIYCGTRQKEIRRLGFNNANQLICLQALDPVHFDIVTSLAVFKDRLISGQKNYQQLYQKNNRSKDKHLKQWNINQSYFGYNKFNSQSNEYEEIQSLETNQNLGILYVGMKDGKIKVQNLQNEQFKTVSIINNGFSTINCLCNITEQPSAIVAGCEKLIKIWRPSQETLENLQKQDQQNNNKPISINNYNSLNHHMDIEDVI